MKNVCIFFFVSFKSRSCNPPRKIGPCKSRAQGRPDLWVRNFRSTAATLIVVSVYVCDVVCVVQIIPEEVHLHIIIMRVPQSRCIILFIPWSVIIQYLIWRLRARTRGRVSNGRRVWGEEGTRLFQTFAICTSSSSCPGRRSIKKFSTDLGPDRSTWWY